MAERTSTLPIARRAFGRHHHLDLWQIHECVYDNDPERHFSKGGAIEALTKARDQGKVRYVGFTGHKDPSIQLRMLSFGYPFDACQLPLNGFDAHFSQLPDPDAARAGSSTNRRHWARVPLAGRGGLVITGDRRRSSCRRS
jgi:aryl-alcohol dehydrogenase-like predicted oxidoreductase